MQRQPVEQGEVQAKILFRVPAAQHLGEGGEQDARGRKADFCPVILEPLPFFRAKLAVHGLAHGGAHGVLAQHGHTGTGSQRRDTFPPVGLSLLVGLHIAAFRQRKHIIAEGQLQRRQFQIRVVVKVLHLHHHGLETQHVGVQPSRLTCMRYVCSSIRDR